MRIRRQSLAIDLLAKVQQLLFADTAFDEGARIDARRRMALNIDDVAAVFPVGARQKWPKPMS